MEASEFDYIVVGAGSAGAVVAARLSEDARATVLLLEAGPRDNNVWLHVPVGFTRNFMNPKYNWKYYTEPEPGLDNRSIYTPRGKTLGGSSAINGMIYLRGVPSDFNQWRQMGNAGWSYDDVLPYFRKLEDFREGSGERGHEGPIKVTLAAWRNDLTEAFIEAGEALGLPRNDGFNGSDQEGIGYFELSQRDGRRSSTSRAYLRPAMKRPNLKVVTRALAQRILLEGRRAAGVAYDVEGTPHQARARREVIVCGGSVNSPQLLQLSGIGPAELLRGHGIEVRHELAGVGENLQDHINCKVAYRVNQPLTINDAVKTLPGRVRAALRYALFRDGALTVGAGIIGAFLKSEPSLEVPDLQVHFFPFSGDSLSATPHPFSGVSAIVNQHLPASRGHVRIKSSDPRTPPSIVCNYLTEEIDQQTLVRGLKFLRTLFDTEPMKSFVVDEISPGPSVATDADWLAFARANGDAAYHLCGTSRMGLPTSRMSVVDERLRVHGIDRLRVADASIMPQITSANTNVTAMMIGEKCAAMVKQDAA
jgi:choline dehydrogenase